MNYAEILENGVDIDELVGEGRLPALLSAVAANDTRDPGQFSYFGRALRDARLVESFSPGLAAPKMTLGDAATVLSATCASFHPAGAPSAVTNLNGLWGLGPDKLDKEKAADSGLPASLQWLHKANRFRDVVAGLIYHADDLATWEAEYLERWEQERGSPTSSEEFSIERLIHPVDPAKDSVRPGYARAVRIVIYVPGIAAELHLGRTWKALDEDNAFHRSYRPRSASPPGADVQGTIEIGVPTLLAIHNAWSTKAKHPRQIARERREKPLTG